MNENLDLTKILKDCPKGTKLYSTVYGYVTLNDVDIEHNRTYPILVNTNKECFKSFTKDGRIYDGYDAECVLFPSKDNRYWSTFKVPNKLPKTWEEFCENHPVTEKECWITMNSDIECSGIGKRINQDKNLFPNKEYAEAMLALCQLIQLRDCYNEGWKPDWLDNTTKYTISFFNENIVCNDNVSYQKVLAFKTRELRNEFFNNFKDLIEIAKPLL